MLTLTLNALRWGKSIKFRENCLIGRILFKKKYVVFDSNIEKKEVEGEKSFAEIIWYLDPL